MKVNSDVYFWEIFEQPISGQCSLSVSPENKRELKVF